MRQAKYRTKRRSCALCKPQKMGWADKNKEKYRAKLNQMKKDIDRALTEKRQQV